MFDRYSIWEIQALNSDKMKLGKFFKMNAKDQKSIFGYVPFGRKNIRLNIEKNEIYISWSIAFGTDSEARIFTSAQLATFLNRQSIVNR